MRIHTKSFNTFYKHTSTILNLGNNSPRSASWSWRLELESCERKILLGWLELELELVAGVV